MSDRPIQVGDLVQVVRPAPCGCTKNIGVTYRVTGVGTGKVFRCGQCGFLWGNGRGFSGYKEYSFDAIRLKRIPPLSELEGERTDEPLEEPA